VVVCQVTVELDCIADTAIVFGTPTGFQNLARAELGSRWCQWCHRLPPGWLVMVFAKSCIKQLTVPAQLSELSEPAVASVILQVGESLLEPINFK
jgi:hypothetical protein